MNDFETEQQDSILSGYIMAGVYRMMFGHSSLNRLIHQGYSKDTEY